jgi:NitT/TauT family transport system substrate-binding protein
MEQGMRKVWILLIAIPLFASPGKAQIVRVGLQFGVTYLPLFVMRDREFLEEEGQVRGLTLNAEWVRLSNGVPMNDALLAGDLDIAAGGVGPLLTIWAKTRANLKVKGVAALNAMPLWLNSSNPEVRSIRDLTDDDRIALPAVKVSVHAVILQMAAQEAFGQGQEGRLDHLTVSMGPPDGMLALLGGHSGVTANFTTAPFMYQELEKPGVHTILNSYDVLGGKHTLTALWTTSRFHDANPKVFSAFLAALERAMLLIREQPAEAAAIWLKFERSGMTPEQAAAMITRPENDWTTAPRKVMNFVKFMHETGAISVMPEQWRDVFFPDLSAPDGS